MTTSKSITSLLASLCLLPAADLMAAAETSKGYVGICKHVDGNRYDFGRTLSNAQYSEGKVLFDEWDNESYGTSKFTFSYDGMELVTESGRLHISHIGPTGEMIAYEHGPGANNGGAGNFYSYGIFPKLNKVVMNRIQLISDFTGDSVMVSAHEFDCEFSSLSTRN